MSRQQNDSKSATPVIEDITFGDSIGLRSEQLATYHDIGPPDLVHLSHYNKSLQKDHGSYHHVTGLDVSSTAAPMAYVSRLSDGIGTYCSFNCFTKCDLRIRITDNDTNIQIIPSDKTKPRSSKNSIVSLQSSTNGINDSFWDEIYVSCVIRSIIISDDYTRQISGLCQFNLISTLTSAKKCISLMIRMLPKGHLVGCDAVVQSSTNFQNYLVDSLIKIVELTNLYEYAISEISKLYGDEFNLIIIKFYILNNQEIKAVLKMYNHLQVYPRDGLVLNEQCKYLISKKRPDLALPLAIRTIEILPSEFNCWTTLFKVHLLNNNIAQALLTINSFPMYTQRHKDITREFVKSPKRFPKPQDGKLAKVWNVADLMGPVYGEIDSVRYASIAEIDAIDPMFLKLRGGALTGTFQVAYSMLSLLVRVVGWDKLLQIRSKVFVMEEEYKQVQMDKDNFKGKRLCERWLDTLFLILYEDLKSVIIIEKEGLNNKSAKHSALEWELIGLASIRCGNYETAISALRTTLNARFSFCATTEIVMLYEYLNNFENIVISQCLNLENTTMSKELVLESLIKLISWNHRWYIEFQPMCISVLKKLISEDSSLSVRYKVKSMCGAESIVLLMDRMINWIDTFDIVNE